MKNISALIEYDFLRPIEELWSMHDGIYIFYCSREDTPYFCTAYFNKDKGLAYLPWARCWCNKYYQEDLDNIKNWRYDFSFNDIHDLQKDHIYYYCKFNAYRRFDRERKIKSQKI